MSDIITICSRVTETHRLLQAARTDLAVARSSVVESERDVEQLEQRLSRLMQELTMATTEPSKVAETPKVFGGSIQSKGADHVPSN